MIVSVAVVSSVVGKSVVVVFRGSVLVIGLSLVVDCCGDAVSDTGSLSSVALSGCRL